MAVKVYEIEGVGPVRLQKRRGTKHLRLSLTAQGDVRVSLPSWAPYRLGLEFVKNKRDWITKHRFEPSLLVDRQAIGKAHRLQFIASQTASRPSSRLTDNIVRVTYSATVASNTQAVQQAAHRGVVKALRQEAEALLPARLAALAEKHGFSYRGVRFKHLRSKWGSCDHTRQITLNIFLMTLPWELIDYVLIHELVHTRILQHGEPFWGEMENQLPDVRELRKRLRAHRPILHSL